jgi:hypothetical protein
VFDCIAYPSTNHFSTNKAFLFNSTHIFDELFECDFVRAKFGFDHIGCLIPCLTGAYQLDKFLGNIIAWYNDFI